VSAEYNIDVFPLDGYSWHKDASISDKYLEYTFANIVQNVGIFVTLLVLS